MDNVLSELTLEVDEQVEINAPQGDVFAALLDQLGPRNQTPAGDSMSLTLEARPGGRWFRDLGGDDGHLWGHVQVIKRPTLLEIVGPLFMSYPAINHVQFRLTREANTTLLALRHQALGVIQADHGEGVTHGWKHLLQEVLDHAERQ